MCCSVGEASVLSQQFYGRLNNDLLFTVTLSGDVPFKGFFIQARDSMGNTIGTFIDYDDELSLVFNTFSLCHSWFKRRISH